MHNNIMVEVETTTTDNNLQVTVAFIFIMQ